MTGSAKRTLIATSVIGCFILFFSSPSLLRDDVHAVPFLFKSFIVAVITFALNVFVLMPRLLFRNRRAAYVLSLFATVLGLLLFLMALSPWHEIEFSQKELPPFHVPFEWLLQIVGMLFVSTLYGFFERERNNASREIDLTHQNIEFEMKFLKSQINPHFLFNALNNIYALSIIKSERTPGMILMLSDMLRFTLYDSESKKVKLKREIEYINNFIEFQKLKTDSDLNIKMDSSNCNDEFLIEPMLLIPFIENSFKHGNIDNPKKGWLTVDIKTLGPILVFQVKNSLPAIAINKDVVGGIGVENVRKRLDILYPGRYEMNIDVSDEAFSVYLKIDTVAY